MSNNKKLSLTLAALVAAGMLGACGDKGAGKPEEKKSEGAAQPAAGATLVYCSEGSPGGFDPAQFTDATTFDASSEPLFNRLVQFKRGGTEIEPGLAEKWDISPDGKTYTFHLRKGVKFHTTEYFKPSREFNADDVVFTFNRLLDKNLGFNKAYAAEFPYFTDMGMPDTLAKIEKVDDATVKFTLKKVNAPFLQNLAMSFASIQSAEYAGKLEADGKAAELNVKPIGTGPFVLKSYQKDSQIRYTKNPDYWNPSDVKIDNLVFSINKDSSVRLQKVQAGECNITTYVKPAEVQAAKKDDKVSVMQQPGFNVGYIAYNVKHGPLAKLEVRQALDMAINKDAIISAVYQGEGVKAANPMPSTQWSYNKDLKDAPYDVEAAKALLKKAGVTDGYEINLWALPVQRPYNPNGKLMAEMIQSDWAKIGVKAKIVTYEWPEYQKRSKAGEADAVMYGWTGDNGDPDNWLGNLLTCKAVGGTNYAQWCNKDFDAKVNKAAEITDQAERTKLYSDAQVIFKKELPWTTMANSVVTVVSTKNVSDFKISPFGLMLFNGVSIK